MMQPQVMLTDKPGLQTLTVTSIRSQRTPSWA